ncbi:MAG: DUF3841 domain-containing protein [Lachnospiraceae bacterium]
MDNTVTLWTRQVPQVWEELQKNGVYTVKEAYIRKKNDTISDYYLELYEWFTKAAGKYLNIDPELKYPIWLSVDESVMLQPTEDTIILKVEIPREHVQICNMEAWGYRVNYWYIPLNAADEKRHNEELKRYGIANEADLIQTEKGNFYPLLKRKIINSWERLFTTKPEKITDSVATAWLIKKEWVREVRRYEASNDVDRTAENST